MTVRAPTCTTELVERLQEVLDLVTEGQISALPRRDLAAEQYWRPGQLGECEGHALTCRHLLKSLYGLDSNLIFCLNDDGKPHLVCCRDGWVLDLRCAWVVRRDALPYTWVAAGRPDGSWHQIFNRRYGV